MTDRRTQLYTLLGVGNRELHTARAGWCEDDYRLILMQCGAELKGGKYSATTMNIQELEAALGRLKALGFKVKKGRSNETWRGPRVAKLNAMWCALADGGHVRNRSQHAMETFCRKRVPGLTRLQWATSEQLNKVVEELKQWCRRCNVRTGD